MIDGPAHEGAARAGGAEENSWTALGRDLLADLAGVLRERLHLLALEGQQAAHAAGRMLALGVVAAVLVLTAWFVFIAAIIALVVHIGVPLSLALSVGAALNLAGAALAWIAMRRLLALMAFPATLRSFQVARASAGTPGMAGQMPLPAGGASSEQAPPSAGAGTVVRATS